MHVMTKVELGKIIKDNVEADMLFKKKKNDREINGTTFSENFHVKAAMIQIATVVECRQTRRKS